VIELALGGGKRWHKSAAPSLPAARCTVGPAPGTSGQFWGPTSNAGVFRTLSHTSSMPCISPRPRTSPINSDSSRRWGALWLKHVLSVKKNGVTGHGLEAGEGAFSEHTDHGLIEAQTRAA